MKPTLFSTAMVRANLEDRKQQTRRLGGLEKINENPDDWAFVRIYAGYAKFTEKHNSLNEAHIKSPFQVGDILYVKETFTIMDYWEEQKVVHVLYENADANVCYLDNREWEKFSKWKQKEGRKSSLFMFKSLSRIWLEVTKVRVERIQQISEADAIAEGIECKEKFPEEAPGTIYYRDYSFQKERFAFGSHFGPKESFKNLWQSIHGEESWNENPWVFVYSFQRVGKPKNI